MYLKRPPSYFEVVPANTEKKLEEINNSLKFDSTSNKESQAKNVPAIEEVKNQD